MKSYYRPRRGAVHTLSLLLFLGALGFAPRSVGAATSCTSTPNAVTVDVCSITTTRECSDPSNPCPQGETCIKQDWGQFPEFAVTAEGGGEISSCDPSYSYVLEAACSPGPGCHEIWQSADGKVFDFLATTQFLMAPDTTTSPSRLRFANQQMTPSAQTFSCMTAIYKDTKEFFAIEIAGGGDYAYPIPSQAKADFANGKPIYLTFIPFNDDGDGNCTSDADGNYNDGGSFVQPPSVSRNAAGDVIAVWITREAWPVPPAVDAEVGYDTVSTCSIEENLTLQNLPYTENGCNIQKPYWEVPEGSDVIRYSGSLIEMLGTDSGSNRVVFIEISPEVTVSAPLTNQYIEYPASFKTSRAACQAALASYNQNPVPAQFPFSECANQVVLDGSSGEYRRSYNYSSDTTAKIIVTGGGRIDGEFIVDEFGAVSGPCDKKSGNNLGSVWSCDHAFNANPDAGGNFNFGEEHVKYAEWKIHSSLLGLSSAYSNEADPHGNFAIDLSQITLSDTPHRNRAAAILNVAQFGPLPLERNDKPVKVFDFKQVGSWVGADDGPEIGGTNSYVENVYFHIADDSIKASVDGLRYTNATILQGADGGAVNIGSYGVNRGVSGDSTNIEISEVWIPRIAQRCMSEIPLAKGATCSDQNDISGDFFKASGGVVIARTCARVAQETNPGTSGNLTGVTIDSLKVFALGSSDLGPNSIAAPVSIGIQDDYFCHLNFEPGVLATSQFMMGDFEFKNMIFGVNPFLKTFFYMQNQTDSLLASFQWEQVSLCEPGAKPISGPASCQFNAGPEPLKPMRMQSANGYDNPTEFPPSWFYYPCGYPTAQSGGFDETMCWTTRGEDNGGSPHVSTTENIHFATGKNQNIYNDIVVIPYGAPEPNAGLAGVVALLTVGLLCGRFGVCPQRA